MNNISINEAFYAVQGEAARTGEASVFLRMAGCNLDCWFCFVPETPILMADGSWRLLGDIAQGDYVVGYRQGQNGKHGQLVSTEVLRTGERVAPTAQIAPALRGTRDHRLWLTGKDVDGQSSVHSGWREANRCEGQRALFVIGPEPGMNRDDWGAGYVAGVANGDGCFWTLKPKRVRRFRLAMNDKRVLATVKDAASVHGHQLRDGRHQYVGGEQPALWLTKHRETQAFESFVGATTDSPSWAWGYIGGILDAEGSNTGPLRIYQQVTSRYYERIRNVLHSLELRFTAYEGGFTLHSRGEQHRRILSSAQPRKRSLWKSWFETSPRASRVIEQVRPTGLDEKVVTVETDIGSFVAAGYVVKNCDTDWRHGDKMPISEVLELVRQVSQPHTTRWVTLTGGEPCYAPGFDELVAALLNVDYQVSVETNGTKWRDALRECHVVVSPKGKWERDGALAAELRGLDLDGDDPTTPARELKLVVEKDDTNEDIVARLLDVPFKPTHFWVQPRYDDRKAWERAYGFVKAFPWCRLSLQTHKWMGIR